MELTHEMLEKAKNTKSAEELMNLAKENDFALAEEEAKAYFEQIHKTGEMSDDELDNVAGGGCRKNGHLVVTVAYSCDLWKCKDHPYSGTKRDKRALEGSATLCAEFCAECGKSMICNHCYYCKYEKGLWLCYNPGK